MSDPRESTEMDDHERRLAEVMWDVLSQLGYEDDVGSAEHQATFASDARIRELASAVYMIVGRVLAGVEASRRASVNEVSDD